MTEAEYAELVAQGWVLEPTEPLKPRIANENSEPN